MMRVPKWVWLLTRTPSLMTLATLTVALACLALWRFYLRDDNPALIFGGGRSPASGSALSWRGL